MVRVNLYIINDRDLYHIRLSTIIDLHGILVLAVQVSAMAESIMSGTKTERKS